MKNHELFNLANQLFDGGNYDEAITLLDSCLCNNPNPRIAFHAYWTLALVIFNKYKNRYTKHPGYKMSNTEALWFIRMQICAKKTKIIFDVNFEIDRFKWAENQEVYNYSIKFIDTFRYYDVGRTSVIWGGVEKRNMEDVRREAQTIPLKCIESEEREFFKKNHKA